jgi:hypothetical protein
MQVIHGIEYSKDAFGTRKTTYKTFSMEEIIVL